MKQNFDFSPEQVDINEAYQETVEMETDKLTIRYDDEEPTLLIAIGPDTFMSQNSRLIHFVQDEERNVTSLLQGGNSYQRDG